MPLLQTNAFDYELAVDFNTKELSLDVGTGADKQLYASFSNQLMPLSACPQPVCKTDPSHHFSLADTYMAYDVRESYLQRQSFAGQAESTYLATNEF
jgi:hypothetical protein